MKTKIREGRIETIKHGLLRGVDKLQQLTVSKVTGPFHSFFGNSLGCKLSTVLNFQILRERIYGCQAFNLRKPRGQLYGVYTKHHYTGGNVRSTGARNNRKQ